MNIVTKIADNGVNTEALIGARGAFEQAPQAAQFTFRSTCDWIEGTYSRNAINGFFGLGQEHERTRTFGIESDHANIRHFLARFRRRTKVISKKQEMVDLSLRLHHYYHEPENFALLAATSLSIFS